MTSDQALTPAHRDMFAKAIITASALLAVVNAIRVTSPGMNTEWNASGAQTITWEAVSTDPDSFQVVLDNQVCRVASRLLLLRQT